MKCYVLSDDLDTIHGLRFAGVQGELVSDPTQLRVTMEKIANMNEYAILMVTETLAGQNRKYIQDLKMVQNSPLIVEIPPRSGSMRSGDFIANYVREAIGIKI